MIIQVTKEVVIAYFPMIVIMIVGIIAAVRERRERERRRAAEKRTKTPKLSAA